MIRMATGLMAALLVILGTTKVTASAGHVVSAGVGACLLAAGLVGFAHAALPGSNP